MSLRGLAASVLLAVAYTMGGSQGTLDPVSFSGLQIWADSFEAAKLVGPNGGIALAGGEISTWIPRRGPVLVGGGSKLVANAIARQSAIQLGNRPFLSATNVSLADRYTLVAAFRLLKSGTAQTLVQVGSSGGLTLRMGADDRIQVWLTGQLALTSRQRWNVRDHAVVTLTSDGAATKLYIDGTLDSQQATGSPLVPQIIGRVAIGNRPDGTEPTKGYLTGVALYRRTLDDSERRAAEDRFLRTLALPRETSYVSTVKGTAGAGGLLPSDPIATLNEAIDRRTEVGGGTISVEAPPELPIRGQVTVDAPVPLTLKGVGSKPWSMVCANRYTNGWQKIPSGTFRRSWATRVVRTMWIETLFESDGLPLMMKPAASLAEIKPGQFLLEDGYLYVRLPDDANPNRNVIEISKETSCLRIANPGGSLHLENGIFRGGIQGAIEAGQPSVGGRVFAKNCIAEYSFCGFKIGGQLSEGVYVNCIARRNTNDGFNLHGYEGVPSTMQITNCEAYLNGDEGASPHDDTRMTITGGRLHHNGCSGFMAIGHSKISLVDLEIDHNGQNGFVEIENGFTAWESVRGRLLRCNIHDNNGPGIYREYPKGITLTDVLSHDNAARDR
ncbi:hypothetical protein EON79_09585 [bacterium]|nr:MAG: hypothetical protein EON79_09585 [bacterium]